MTEYFEPPPNYRRAAELKPIMDALQRETDELANFIRNERAKAMAGSAEDRRVFNANIAYWARDHKEKERQWWEYYREVYRNVPRDYMPMQMPDGSLQLGWKPARGTAFGVDANARPSRTQGNGMKKTKRKVQKK